MNKFEKFKAFSIPMNNVYGGIIGASESTGDCQGTGCFVLKNDGKIKDWDDVECGDTQIGKNSGKCDPVARL